MKTLPVLFRILLVVVVGASARADLYRVIGKGNTITPLRSSEIAMDAETVLVTPEKDFGGFEVHAVFTTRNASDQVVECDVAFPFESKGAATNAREGFKVSIGEAPNATSIEHIELKLREALFAEWLYREMFARHGDPFFIGKHRENELPPDARYKFVGVRTNAAHSPVASVRTIVSVPSSQVRL
jgi:hypothetical protein